MSQPEWMEAMSLVSGPNWSPWMGGDDTPWVKFQPVEVRDDGKPTMRWRGDQPPDKRIVYLRLGHREAELVVNAVHVETLTGAPLVNTDMRVSFNRYLDMIHNAVAAEVAQGKPGPWSGIVEQAVASAPGVPNNRRIGGLAAGAYSTPQDDLRDLAERWGPVRDAATTRTKALEALAARYEVSRKTIYTRLAKCVELGMLTEEEAAR